MKNIFKNQHGMSLIEIMIGFGLLAVGSFIIINGVDYIEKKKVVVEDETYVENMILNLVESIRSNIHMEKIDFAPDKFLKNTAVTDIHNSLKLCWGKEGVIPLDKFPSCPGRIGYVITPLKIGPVEKRGLYRVTIRLTHSVKYPQTHKEYQFVVKDP